MHFYYNILILSESVTKKWKYFSMWKAQPTAETDPVVESAPVTDNTPQSQGDSSPTLVEQPTPQATNEMQPVSEEVAPTAEEIADAQAFADAYAANTLEAYQNYLDNHPEGAYREGARRGIWALEGTSSVADIASITNAENVLRRAQAAQEADLEKGEKGEKGQKAVEGEVSDTPSLLDVVKTLYSKGKEVASRLFSMKFFDVAKTPGFMQELGLRGDKFTIKYGVIARHLGKDGSHDLSEKDWEQLPQALQNPFAISKLTDKKDSYRIYTTLQTESGEFVVVGADVKNAGREIEVNAVSTVFGRRNNANLPKNEEVIYRSKEITPEQSSLLKRPNFAQYPTEQELSTDEGTTQSAKVQENTQKSGEEIQEPRSVEEILENGDKRITNYNSRGEVATVATERDGKVVSVDSYDEGVLFEHTEYDGNGVSTSVTRYDKSGNAIGTQIYVDGKAAPNGKVKGESGKPNAKSGKQTLTDKVVAKAKEKQRARFADHAKGIAEKLGVEVTVHNDESTVTNKSAMKAIAEGGEVKGWYNPITGEIALFMPNMESMRDVESTILHEAVSHYGIKHFLGKEDFNNFLDGVWDMMPAGVRAHFLQYVGADMKNPSKAKMRQAADEYVAHIAEKMDLNELERSVWQRFIDYVMDVLRKAGFKNLRHRDVEAVIRASYANLRKNGNVKTENGKVSQVTGGETMASKKMSERRQEKNRINNVLDEVGGIIYGNKEYAKKQRLKREAERKELAKEIYSSVLKGDFNDVTLSQIDKFIEDATPANPFGRRISQRLPQRMERALRQGARANAVDALFSRISESAVPANERFSEAGRRKIEERKKELLKGWAIATGNWHTDLKEFTDDTEPIGEGKDSKVYSSKDGRYVIKASKGKPFGKRFRPDIDNIALFNDVFRDTRYEILGYGEIDGEFVRILQQPIVDFAESTPLTSEERREYMQSLGFEPLNDANTAFADGEIVIADLQKGNVVRDAAGNISVIDADAKLHTKDVGGDYTYPPVETDLPEGTDLGGTMFRRANKNQEVFVSNAQRAVEGIKQEKATPEQWIAMLKKNGGLKAGEEAWLGLEEWLTEKGKVKGER